MQKRQTRTPNHRIFLEQHGKTVTEAVGNRIMSFSYLLLHDIRWGNYHCAYPNYNDGEMLRMLIFMKPLDQPYHCDLLPMARNVECMIHITRLTTFRLFIKSYDQLGPSIGHGHEQLATFRISSLSQLLCRKSFFYGYTSYTMRIHGPKSSKSVDPVHYRYSHSELRDR